MKKILTSLFLTFTLVLSLFNPAFAKSNLNELDSLKIDYVNDLGHENRT